MPARPVDDLRIADRQPPMSAIPVRDMWVISAELCMEPDLPDRRRTGDSQAVHSSQVQTTSFDRHVDTASSASTPSEASLNSCAKYSSQSGMWLPTIPASSHRRAGNTERTALQYFF